MWKIGMPNLGHTMEFGKVVEWLKARGDGVRAGEAIALVETDKVTVEVEAPSDGLLLEIVAEPETVVPVGGMIAIVGRPDEAERAAETAAAGAEPGAPPATAPPAPAAPPPPVARQAPAAAKGLRRPVSPAARRRAEELGVALDDVEGSGPEGLVTREDVERAAEAQPVRIVLIHGFGSDPEMWALAREALGRLDGGRRRPVAAPALPGHSGGPALPPVPDVEGLADALRGDPAFAGSGPLHLVGHSLGGAVAVVLATRLGERVQALSLASPLGLGETVDAAFLADFLAAADPERARAALARLLARPERASRIFLKRTVALLTRPGVREAFAAIADACFPDGRQAWRAAPALAALRCPVQILWGRQDAVIPASQSAAAPPQADVTLFAEAGHLLPVERPEAFAASLAAFAGVPLSKGEQP